MQRNTRIRIWVYSLLLSAVIAFYIWCLYPHLHMSARARHVVTILQPRIAADARFAGVHISSGPYGIIRITGAVHSDAELDALKSLVYDAYLPRTWPITVKVTLSSTPK